MQDINLATKNQHIVPAEAQNGVYILVQESEPVGSEAKSNIDHAERKADRDLTNFVANDPVLSNSIFPPITTSHGI